MIANRRLVSNFALDRALEYCRTLGQPLIILEALRCDYQWASDRHHCFILDGMADNARTCAQHNVLYYPYVEFAAGAGKGLLEALASEAAIVITDDFPCFFLPRMVAAAAKKLAVRLEAVDSNGLLPIRAVEQVFSRAFDFRRYLQKNVSAHLFDFPSATSFSKATLLTPPKLPRNTASRWPSANSWLLGDNPESLSSFPINHRVKPSEIRGGHSNAVRQMKAFFQRKFGRYAELHNEPELDVSSGLSPYLHFGHLSVHEIFTELVRREKWKPEKLAVRSNGSREGWWNMSPTGEAFLDELITWREVGYNFSSHRDDYGRYESLPDWAQETLKKHVRDERQFIYSLEQFENAETHDRLWNAAQLQLVREGRIHNYLRMLWGKKILEWTRTPQDAAAIMIELNNKYGLDGRNPNSYSGIFWVLGRYDRPWGPERPVFGHIRYMSSENTARKISVKNYIQKYSVGV
jgi:deoxyribodipyrimidine photo-lyase